MDTTMHMLLSEQENSHIEAQVADYAPMQILEIEIGQPLVPLSIIDEKTGKHYQHALCLVRLHTQPLGVVELELTTDGISANIYAEHIWCTLRDQINDHLHQDGLPSVSGLDAKGLPCPCTPRCLEEREQFLAHAPFVSIIVPTRDRLERIQRCLHTLLALNYPHYEIIVVDNAPNTTATADFIQQTYCNMPHVRYMREDRPGPSWARNHGIVAAKGEILAFADDDIIVDSNWLLALVKGFSVTDNVACVTGLVLPLELETPAQLLFEEYGGYGKGFTQRIFDMKENRPKLPLYPYTGGLFGTGGSMAFRASFLRSINGFDPVLSQGEDIDAFFQVVMHGYKLVYEPAAVVYHPHHRDYNGLRYQIYTYGIGPTACLTKSLFNNPRLLFDLVPKLPYGLFFILSTRSSKNSKKSSHYPKELTRLELKGMFNGPDSYLRSWWAMHHTPKTLIQSDADIPFPIEKKVSTMSTLVLQRIKTHSVLLFNAASLVGTMIVTSVLGFVYWWMVAREFTPQAVGLASAAVSAMILMGNVCILGLGTLLAGELPRQRGNASPLISAALILVGIVGGCVGLIFAGSAPFISSNFHELGASTENIVLFAVGVSLTSITLVLDQALIGLLRGELQLWRNTLFAVAKLVALLGVSFGLSYRTGMTIYATWAIGNGISLVILAGYIVLKRKRTIKSYLPQWRLLQKLGHAAIQHHVLNLLLLTPGLALPSIVTIMLSPTSNAWFYVSTMMAGFISIVLYALTNVLYAMNAAQPDAIAHKIRMTLGLAFATCIAGNFVLQFGAQQILGLFGHIYAEQATSILRIMALGAFPIIIKDHYLALSRIYGRMVRAISVMTIGALLELGTASLGAHFGGLFGLSLGWLLAICAEAVVMFPTVYRATRLIDTAKQGQQGETAIEDIHTSEPSFGQ